MTVREALIEINYALDEYLSKEESEKDNRKQTSSSNILDKLMSTIENEDNFMTED